MGMHRPPAPRPPMGMHRPPTHRPGTGLRPPLPAERANDREFHRREARIQRDADRQHERTRDMQRDFDQRRYDREHRR